MNVWVHAQVTPNQQVSNVRVSFAIGKGSTMCAFVSAMLRARSSAVSAQSIGSYLFCYWCLLRSPLQGALGCCVQVWLQQRALTELVVRR